MIYAYSFAIFAILVIFSGVIVIVTTLILKFSKNEQLKDRIKPIDFWLTKTMNFSLFMMLASLTLAAIFKDSPEMFIPQNVWNLVQQHESLGVLAFVVYLWLTLDRRLTKVETQIAHIDGDVESLRIDFKEEFKQLRDDIRHMWNNISKK